MSRKIKLSELFANFHLDKVKLGPGWANIEIHVQSADKDAAWELFVEMQTRIVSKSLSCDIGDYHAAQDSVYSLFPMTRKILRRHGRSAANFGNVAIFMLNQKVRPFTTKWHRERLAGAFDDSEKRREFRQELAALQRELREYNRVLAKIADVEVFTEQVEGV